VYVFAEIVYEITSLVHF